MGLENVSWKDELAEMLAVPACGDIFISCGFDLNATMVIPAATRNRNPTIDITDLAFIGKIIIPPGVILN